MELSLSRDQAYVRQSLILKLRVISRGALASATPSLDDLAHARTELIKGPVSEMRARSTGREQVNDYYFLLQPLRSGTLRIAPVRLSATDARGQQFVLEAESVPELKVLPAPSEQRPWLPLNALRLTASSDPNAEIAPGKPLTLTLALEAEGGTAEQLPSLEPLLASASFRRYRERTLTDTHLDAKGQRLLARRTEIYTLVPRSEGPLQLPPMRLQWWNVDTNRPEVARTARRILGRAVGGNARAPQAEQGFGLGFWLAWIPLIAVMPVLIGLIAGWRFKIGRSAARNLLRPNSGGVAPDPAAALGSADSVQGSSTRKRQRETDPKSGRKPKWQQPWRRDWSAAILGVGARLAAMVDTQGIGTGVAQRRSGMRIRAGARLASWRARVVKAVVEAMPAPWRLRLWLRELSRCVDPDAFCVALRERSRQVGWLTPGEPLARLSARLSGQSAGAERAARQSALGSLFAELEAARYGAPPLDLADWRRRLRRQLWSRLGQRHRARAPHPALPPLNPAHRPIASER